ncbi:ribonuclease 3 [Clostridia bacterium]|nr:ribonuclease 3 [Clostridia bacterium]
MHIIEQQIGYTFHNPALLRTALTHSSFANENKAMCERSNERMEFLGDSVLGLVVAENLYINNKSKQEGELTRARATVVCERSLCEVAQELELGHHLLLGHGEDIGGGRTRPSTLADAVEALIAALYLDGGLEAARGFISKYLLRSGKISAAPLNDYKTELQEILQREKDNIINYRMSGESGPDHAKTFSAQVLVNCRIIGSGTGGSKKEAEQEAARVALERLKK